MRWRASRIAYRRYIICIILDHHIVAFQEDINDRLETLMVFTCSHAMAKDPDRIQHRHPACNLLAQHDLRVSYITVVRLSLGQT